MKTYVIKTLGCKVNRYESDALSAALEARGWRPAEAGEPVGLCVVNTCTVTGKGAMQSRQEIRRLARRHPETRLVVTGCHAQVAPGELSAIPGVDAVVGTADKMRIAEEGYRPRQDAEDALCRDAEFEHPPVLATGRRSRPVVKIQDGCDAFCSYCIVPYARGRSRSSPPGQVLSAVTGLAEAGYCEAVLSGIHLGRYGRDLRPATDLTDLMRRLEASRPIQRIRLSSVEPNEIDEEMLDIMARSPLFCRHLHVPLQSGNDNVLKRMNRTYTAAFYARQVRRIRERLPDAAIGADVLVGFPGESENDFADTCALVNDLPLTYLHVFPFSPRPGTPAEGFAGRVQESAIRLRCRRLRRLGRQKKEQFLARWIGKEMEVLVESGRDRDTGRRRGVSSQYAVVLLDEGGDCRNRIVRARIEGIDDRGRLLGSVSAPHGRH